VANAIYPKYKEALLSGDTDISMISPATVKITLLTNDVLPIVYDSSHVFYSEINAVNKLDEETFTNVSVVNGVFKADDVSFDSVLEDSECDSLVIWIDTGVPATSRLVCFMDTNVVGLPLVADGTPVDLTFNTSGIFQL
jgi:hypothetical protein